jgi:hypothetical protein
MYFCSYNYLWWLSLFIYYFLIFLLVDNVPRTSSPVAGGSGVRGLLSLDHGIESPFVGDPDLLSSTQLADLIEPQLDESQVRNSDSEYSAELDFNSDVGDAENFDPEGIERSERHVRGRIDRRRTLMPRPDNSDRDEQVDIIVDDVADGQAGRGGDDDDRESVSLLANELFEEENDDEQVQYFLVV